MVADREMPAWQCTNTLPPSFLTESEKIKIHSRQTSPTASRGGKAAPAVLHVFNPSLP